MVVQVLFKLELSVQAVVVEAQVVLAHLALALVVMVAMV
jgi:hypothetical protein